MCDRECILLKIMDNIKRFILRGEYDSAAGINQPVDDASYRSYFGGNANRSHCSGILFVLLVNAWLIPNLIDFLFR